MPIGNRKGLHKKTLHGTSVMSGAAAYGNITLLSDIKSCKTGNGNHQDCESEHAMNYVQFPKTAG